MNFSIPAAGLESAGRAFDSAASAITQAFNQPVNQPGGGDSVDLSASVAALLKSKLDFQANVKVAEVQNETASSTFSVLG